MSSAIDYFRNPNTGQFTLTGEGPTLFMQKHGGLVLGLAVVAAVLLLRRK